MSDDSLEAPEADVAEQQAAAVPGDTVPDETVPDETVPDDDSGDDRAHAPPLEADAADAAEQARGLGPDTEDEYR
jgi:hypothetical protein